MTYYAGEDLSQDSSNNNRPYGVTRFPSGNHLAARLGFDQSATGTTSPESPQLTHPVVETDTVTNTHVQEHSGNTDLPPAYGDHVHYPATNIRHDDAPPPYTLTVTGKGSADPDDRPPKYS